MAGWVGLQCGVWLRLGCWGPMIARARDGVADGGQAAHNEAGPAELRGQGIASRALQAFLTWAADQIGLRRAHLTCHIDNLASRRVVEKCGFVLLSQHGEEYQFRRDLAGVA
jgi:RimJ/RimL family protein N-acetyltransferase